MVYSSYFYVDTTLKHFSLLGEADIPCDCSPTHIHLFVEKLARSLPSYAFSNTDYVKKEDGSASEEIKMCHFCFNDFDDAARFLKFDNRYTNVHFFDIADTKMISVIDWLQENNYQKNYKFDGYVKDRAVLAINDNDIAVQFKLWFDDDEF